MDCSRNESLFITTKTWSRNRQILPHQLLWLRIDSHALRGMTKSKSIYFLRDMDPWCPSSIRKEFDILSLYHSSELPQWHHNSSEDTAIMREAVCVRFEFAVSFLRVLQSGRYQLRVDLRDTATDFTLWGFSACCSLNHAKYVISFAVLFISLFCFYQHRSTSIMEVLWGE